MSVPDSDFAPFLSRMQAAGLPEIAIRTFRRYYEQLVQGESGHIAEADLEPIDALPDAEKIAARHSEAGQAALPRTILLKLNGGLGTGMGLERAKSLLEVKGGLTFLDIIARQALGSRVPLVLMNSAGTQAESLAALKRYPGLWGGIPLDFLQHSFPKIDQSDLSPVSWPKDPEHEWYPPGHADIYTALITSGMLKRLLEAGYRYAFVSNADNLGAVLEPGILGYFVEHSLPFMMEVADRTAADRKGGHLARLRSGRLILRESAQTLADEVPVFQDIRRHKYFNTNNLWLNLNALSELLEARAGVLGLPIIVNKKTVDPRDAGSKLVYQLEAAMGAAVGVFEGAQAIRVPRSRFAPVKTTDDLLGVRSDAYVLTGDYRVVPNPARTLSTPVVMLDPAFYRLIDALEDRFPHGAPSLLDCERLEVRGDFLFGRNVVLRGTVRLANVSGRQEVIADGAVIQM